MPKKKTKNNKRTQNNSLAVIVILIIATFAVTTCSRKIAGLEEKTPAKKSSRKKNNKPPAAKNLLLENFEKGSKTNYNTGSEDFSSGSWELKNAVTGTTEEDHKVGKQALRLRDNGSAAMNFDVAVKGIVTVTLKYALYSNDKEGSWELWASVNKGQRYTRVGNTVSVTANTLRTATFTVSSPQTIRFEIRKTDKTGSRLNVDAFTVTAGGRLSPETPASDGHPATGDDSHLLLGNPSDATPAVVMTGNYLMDKGYFVLSYNRDKGTPNWVSWHVSSKDLGSMSRANDFRPDADLPGSWYQVTQSSYIGSGFDRGHNCPSGDRTATRDANEATFLMTNMIPQAPNHNQHLWKNLEDYTRDLVREGNEVYVIMGSYGAGGTGSKGLARKIDNGRIQVPDHIWKVLVILPAGNNDLQRINKNTRIIAVNTPNKNDVNPRWTAYLTSIAEIEEATGYKLLDKVPANVRQELIRKIDDGQ
ncbi:DNA/RNA non-specific endonuclease [Chitinophaga nivalis]|uniref:DNA/RNA non-specific endonuclease n=1 Tax=Chitinophaga nivalis TaxID=2991709 RepID=A0ABT3IHY5_9BACT|nr:DNA/RNA non-specific endonuclease [Chitinophaga nivalis]MCW3466763.1 DNA/RNA non-specific endonuclease [Chitinophaga nivalis]MCW3483546.1 DNA/RNA non-specific endonuclease [Chitinophaga nivalis]